MPNRYNADVSINSGHKKRFGYARESRLDVPETKVASGAWSAYDRNAKPDVTLFPVCVFVWMPVNAVENSSSKRKI